MAGWLWGRLAVWISGLIYLMVGWLIGNHLMNNKKCLKTMDG
jgi:hypothetical protein